VIAVDQRRERLLVTVAQRLEQAGVLERFSRAWGDRRTLLGRRVRRRVDSVIAVRAYKFLDGTGRSLFSGFAWPRPAGGEPGAWVDAGTVRPSYRGIHACRADQLAYWLTDELWEIELDAPVMDATHKVVARRGRLVRCFDEWRHEVANAHATQCAWRARSHAVEALVDLGEQDLAESLSACTTLAELAATASAVATGLDADSLAGRLVALAGDAGRVDELSAVAGAPFIAACAAGTAAEVMGSTGGFDDAFDAERRAQSAWIVRRLGAG
jgi:hypothetical protein